MKKFLLSSFVIVIFAMYAVYLRIGNPFEERHVVTPPPAIVREQIPSLEDEDDEIPRVRAPQLTPATTTTPPTTPKSTSTPKPAPVPTPVAQGQYRDGVYTGISADAYYGFIQVRVTIKNGKIVDVTFLDYPKDRNTSIAINTQAMVYFKQEAIQAQSANVNIVSGATDSSGAFRQSLASALSQAKN